MKLFFILSNFKNPNLDNILENSSISHYMISYRKPTTFYLSHIVDGKRAIVSDSGLLK